MNSGNRSGKLMRDIEKCGIRVGHAHALERPDLRRILADASEDERDAILGGVYRVEVAMAVVLSEEMH